MMDNYPNGMSRSDLIHVGEIAEPHESRLDWLQIKREKARDERTEALNTIDRLDDYIDELDDAIYKLEVEPE